MRNPVFAIVCAAVTALALAPQTYAGSDVDGDGKEDAVFYLDQTGEWWIGLAADNKFLPAQPARWAVGYGRGCTQQFLADVNGDKKADAVVVDHVARTIIVRLSNGKGFGEAQLWSAGWISEAVGLFLADVTGDGKADAIALDPTANLVVRPSEGTTFGEFKTWGKMSQTAAAEHSLLFGDVDGDGKDDTFEYTPRGAWIARLSNGDKFAPKRTWTSNHGEGSVNQFLRDVNGDGKADAIVYKPDNSWWVELSDGTKFVQPAVRWAQDHMEGSSARFLADVNGDGKADAIAFDEQSGNWHIGLSDGKIFTGATIWAQTHGNGSNAQFAGGRTNVTLRISKPDYTRIFIVDRDDSMSCQFRGAERMFIRNAGPSRSLANISAEEFRVDSVCKFLPSPVKYYCRAALHCDNLNPGEEAIVKEMNKKRDEEFKQWREKQDAETRDALKSMRDRLENDGAKSDPDTEKLIRDRNKA
jgi:hypothetical protein